MKATEKPCLFFNKYIQSLTKTEYTPAVNMRALHEATLACFFRHVFKSFDKSLQSY